MHQTNLKTYSRSGKAGVGLILGVVGIAIIILVVIVVLRGFSGGGQPLPILAMAAEPKAFSGNSYQLEARIDALLKYEEGVGRLLLTRDIDSNQPVPVFIPAQFVEFSPNPGQVYRFKVQVSGDGMVVANSYKKL